jgi:hypothetical protein
MPPYATLGLAARKALPGSRAAGRDIDSSTRGMDGCTFLFFQATPNAPQRQGRLVVLPPGIRPPDSHAPRHGQPSVRRKRQCDENNRNEHLSGVRLSFSSCGSRPALLPGINARPSRLALPGPPWPHHHCGPGPRMRQKMLEESPWQGIGASLGTPPRRSSQPLATYGMAHKLSFPAGISPVESTWVGSGSSSRLISVVSTFASP